MSTFIVQFVFDVGDPESAAVMTIEREGADAEAVTRTAMDQLFRGGKGFTAGDLIHYTVRKKNHGVRVDFEKERSSPDA